MQSPAGLPIGQRRGILDPLTRWRRTGSAGPCAAGTPVLGLIKGSEVMRFCSMVGILLLAGCSMFSSKSGGGSTLTLNNPYWEQVNVEVVLTRSSDCENRDGYISTAQILMRKNKTEAVDVPSGANVCWRHDRNPVNPIIEGAAEADIRTIMVRQERIGLHMCDAVAKVTSGDKIGVFVMQHGPGTENAFGGVAQSYGDSCPVVVLPAGYARNINQV